MLDRIIAALAAALGIGMLSVAAHSAEPEMSPWPCPHDTLHCHQKVVSIPPGKPGEILVWSGNDFVWVVACATVDPAGRLSAVWPIQRGMSCEAPRP